VSKESAATKVTIYHGYESDGRMVSPLENNSALPTIAVKAYSYETDQAGIDLDVIYRMNNAVDGREYNVLNEARSLSIGDVIEIGVGEFHLVGSVGFSQISQDLFDSILLISKEARKDRFENFQALTDEDRPPQAAIDFDNTDHN